MIETISYQELKGNDKQIVDEKFESLIAELKETYNAEILSNESDEDGEFYSKIAELKIKFETVLDYIKYCLRYGADLDVVSPTKLKISGNEMGNAILYIIDFFKKFAKKYGVAFNVYVKNEIDADINALKEGIYDEDDIYLMESEEGLLKIKTVFEGDGKSEEIIIKKILASLNPDIVVNKVITKSMDESKGIFSGLVAIEMFCKPFDIVEVAYKFLPVAISFENADIELDISELQDIGNDLGGAVFELTHAAANMNKK
ncbi:hypothetical protein HNP87_000412 [Methanococcus maripaludis]|uniref:Uncharacterized protein n=1 Tax=Methanococcus maripaludis TaxID=39152 RepID=A0A7J9NHB2_METMI|nr:hypothetical protein [Methanococcus maripaludis]MBA2839900.1 hypothetical protein [Methanococcus maripaludis]